MSETSHVIIVGAILAIFPVSLLVFWIWIMIRDFRLDRAEERENNRVRLKSIKTRQPKPPRFYN